MSDPRVQEMHNKNLLYWEKMKEVRLLTFYLHVIAGTLVCVEYPSKVEKALVEDHILGFVHVFFYAIEGLYCYFITSTALSLPSCGCLEYILIMIFNGVSSQHYITFVDKDRARYILMLWNISAGILLIFTLKESWNQLYKAVATTIDRLCFILTKICEVVDLVHKKIQNKVQRNRNEVDQENAQPVPQENAQAVPQEADPQEIFNRNYFYFEKQKEMRNITMWLHVISGTLVTLENPVIGVKEIMDNLNFLHFIHPFFKSIQILYLYYFLSIALSPPRSGTFEYILVMIFNGLTSFFYVEYSDQKLAWIVSRLWIISAVSLLLYTAEDTYKQVKCIFVTGKDRLKNIRTMAQDIPHNTMEWLYAH
ncbi:hypothetical protein MtrunA17_Chr8g0336351 [Medicago truncatula]|uniref:Transmembrane protein, putative n=1 Tax=Medicago truncatula TaxID=3880 RepID=G7LBP7_MEDTR|nr:transmembrane protein, putative [Medicago truncatula]RHN38729.1 hypothetical protein MtrunA17_Chr8g0336351 [Medicago truncatula]